MGEVNIRKLNMLNEILDEMKNINTDEINIDYFNLEEPIDDFDFQNIHVFKMNLYILMKLYKEEIDKIKMEKGKFELDEYYLLLESINLPVKLYQLYIKMPEFINNKRILSYTTDIPSFMGMIKD